MSKFPSGIWLFSTLPCLRNGVSMSTGARAKAGLVTTLSTLPRSVRTSQLCPASSLSLCGHRHFAFITTVPLLSLNSPASFWVSLPPSSQGHPSAPALWQGSYCSQIKIPKSKRGPVQTWWDASLLFQLGFHSGSCPHSSLPASLVFPQPPSSFGPSPSCGSSVRSFLSSPSTCLCRVTV